MGFPLKINLRHSFKKAHSNLAMYFVHLLFRQTLLSGKTKISKYYLLEKMSIFVPCRENSPKLSILKFFTKNSSRRKNTEIIFQFLRGNHSCCQARREGVKGEIL